MKEKLKKLWLWLRREVLNKRMLIWFLTAEAIFWSPVISGAVLGFMVDAKSFSVCAIYMGVWALPFTPAIPLQLGLAYGLKKAADIIKRKKHNGGDNVTFEEVKNLLQNLRTKKRMVRAIKNRIAEMRDDEGMLRSSLGGDGMPHGTDISDSTARLALRIVEKCEQYKALLDECFQIEDKLASALSTLSDDEQYIIIECYMSSKAIWKVAEEIGYCDRTVKRKKRQAIEKIAQKL